MPSYMARLGSYTFSLDTAAFQDLQRQSAFRWQAQERIGRKSAMQFTGLDPDTITLSGVIYPHFRGGLGQVAQMRAIAGRGVQLPFIYTSERVGQFLGNYCITAVSEGRTFFFDNGAPRKIEFSISLSEYGDDTLALLPGAVGAASVAAEVAGLRPAAALADISARVGAVVSEAREVSDVAGAVGLAATLGSAAAAVANGVQSTYDALIKSNAGKIIRTAAVQVNSVMDTVKTVRAAAEAVRVAGSDPVALVGALEKLGGASALASRRLGETAASVLAAGGIASGASAATLLSVQAGNAAESFATFAGNLSDVEAVANSLGGVLLG